MDCKYSNIYKLRYKYNSDDDQQYDGLEFQFGVPVQAEYMKSDNPMCNGNPFIEALPRPLGFDDVSRYYTHGLYGYDINKVKDMSVPQRLNAAGRLREIRLALPFHREIEVAFYSALVTSYSARKALCDEDANVELTVNNKVVPVNRILCGDPGDSTNSGFSIVGYSGCGKSSSISILKSRYPQVIIHGSGMETFPQIVYLVVNCPPNSNFNALYDMIGDAIDKALGNIKPIYYTKVHKARGLGNKAAVIKMLTELFAIGCIIFDEIQLVDFSSTKENSFEGLMTLSNNTKAAVVAIGTEDALGMMFKKLRTARRVGRVITAHSYCGNREFFNYLVKRVLSYQWFETIIEYSDDLSDAFYDVTKGVIDQLISVYYCMHIEYYSRKKRPEVNGDFVRKVAKKYYPNIQNLLASLETGANLEELSKAKGHGAEAAKAVLDSIRQKENAEAIMSKSVETAESQINVNEIIDAISTMFGYSASEIENAYKTIKTKGKTKQEICKAVCSKLEKAKNKRSCARKPEMSEEQMIAYLNSDKDDLK